MYQLNSFSSQHIFNTFFADEKKQQMYQDCTEIKEINRNNTSGVYKIYHECRDEVSVYCDMETDGGGWTPLRV